MNNFIKLFSKYNFEVTEFPHNSFIADNGKVLIVGTVYHFYDEPTTTAAAFYSEDRKEIEEKYKNSKYGIGAEIYTNIMNNHNKFTLRGRIFNHDHSLLEIESALEHFSKI